MIFIHVFMSALSAWRLTEIVTQDSIFQPIRVFWLKYCPIQAYKNFLTCTWCVSVWAGAAATLTFHFFPFANWPFAFSKFYLIATAVMASLASLTNHLTNNQHRKIVIMPDIKRIEWGPFDADFGLKIMEQIVNSEKHKPQSPQANLMAQGNGR